MYKIASAKNEEELEKIVNNLIANGYEPFGSVAITSYITGQRIIVEFFQPMIKR